VAVVPARAADQPITLANGVLSVTVDPAQGGRVSSLKLLPAGADWVQPQSHPGWGLALDHFVAQAWPGELLQAPYRVVTQGDNSVTLEVPVTGQWQSETAPELAGLVLRKRLTLAPDRAVVTVHLQVVNPTQAAKRFEYWAQQIPRPAPAAQLVYYRPTTRGVEALACVPGNTAPEFAADPTAGWCALLAPQAQAGVVFTLDYNELRTFYSALSAATCEWMYDPVSLAPGESWETTYQIRPVQGMPGVTAAGSQAVVYLEPKVQGQDLSFTLWAAAGTGAESAARLLVTGENRVGGDHQWKLEARPATLGPEGAAVLADQLVGGLRSYLLRLQCTDRQGQVDEFAAVYHAPGQDDYADYRLSPPPKTVAPATGSASGPPAGNRALALEGLFHDVFGVDRALSTVGLKTDRGLEWVNTFGAHLTFCPATYEELRQYRLVVLCDIDARALDTRSQAALREFVKAGGGLLVLGGYYAYGNGAYATSQFYEVLPVTCGPPFDFADYPTPGTLTIGTLPPGLRLPASLRELPGGLRFHRLTARPGASVVLRHEGQPALVAWQVEQGRVACFGGTALGHSPRPGAVFWESEDWPAFLTALMGWLASDRQEVTK
jgi:uncharacterized membrane protein